MSLTTDIARLHGTIDEDTSIHMQNDMTDFYTLYAALDAIDHPDDVIKYIIVELKTRNRPSYIERLYGRYRKMIAVYDKETLANWSATNGQGRK